MLDHWADRGWKFAVSADMSEQLRAEIGKLAPQDWQFWEEEKGGFVREWAEVPYVPSREGEKKDTKPYRYLAIRIRSPQGVLFSDGNKVKTFAVVSNDWETEGRALLEWHRGKAGTVEHTHQILKDELAAGVYPSGKFGADAAWLRLQVLTANLLALMKAVALDSEYRKARPKRLRFAIFNHVGRVVHHARESFIRLHRLLLERMWAEEMKEMGRRGPEGQPAPARHSGEPGLGLGHLDGDAGEGVSPHEGYALSPHADHRLLVHHLHSPALDHLYVRVDIVGVHAEVVDAVALLPYELGQHAVLAVVLQELQADGTQLDQCHLHLPVRHLDHLGHRHVEGAGEGLHAGVDVLDPQAYVSYSPYLVHGVSPTGYQTPGSPPQRAGQILSASATG